MQVYCVQIFCTGVIWPTQNIDHGDIVFFLGAPAFVFVGQK